MAHRALTWALLMGCLSACSDSSDPFGGSFADGCTQAGCFSFVRVELTFASPLTRDDVEVVVQHSERSFTCSFGSDDDPCHQGFPPEFDPGGSADPTDTVVLLSDTPEQLRIIVTTADGPETQLVEPQYERNQPNGSGCPPTCLSASTTAHFNL